MTLLTEEQKNEAFLLYRSMSAELGDKFSVELLHKCIELPDTTEEEAAKLRFMIHIHEGGDWE